MKTVTIENIKSWSKNGKEYWRYSTKDLNLCKLKRDISKEDFLKLVLSNLDIKGIYYKSTTKPTQKQNTLKCELELEIKILEKKLELLKLVNNNRGRD